MTHRTNVDVDVPPGAETHVCPYCSRPFSRENYLVLHYGVAHRAEMTAEERAAYEAEYEREQADIARFRIVALGALVAIYFGFLFAYAVFA